MRIAQAHACLCICTCICINVHRYKCQLQRHIVLTLRLYKRINNFCKNPLAYHLNSCKNIRTYLLLGKFGEMTGQQSQSPASKEARFISPASQEDATTRARSIPRFQILSFVAILICVGCAMFLSQMDYLDATKASMYAMTRMFRRDVPILDMMKGMDKQHLNDEDIMAIRLKNLDTTIAEFCAPKEAADDDQTEGEDGVLLDVCGPVGPKSWQCLYAKLHREILLGQRRALTVTAECGALGAKCGGWGDRVRGITNLLYMSMLKGRAFIINYDRPSALEHVFVPRAVEWQLKFDEPTSDEVSDTEGDEVVHSKQPGATVINVVENENWRPDANDEKETQINDPDSSKDFLLSDSEDEKENENENNKLQNGIDDEGKVDVLFGNNRRLVKLTDVTYAVSDTRASQDFMQAMSAAYPETQVELLTCRSCTKTLINDFLEWNMSAPAHKRFVTNAQFAAFPHQVVQMLLPNMTEQLENDSLLQGIWKAVTYLQPKPHVMAGCALHFLFQISARAQRYLERLVVQTLCDKRICKGESEFKSLIRSVSDDVLMFSLPLKAYHRQPYNLDDIYPRVSLTDHWRSLVSSESPLYTRTKEFVLAYTNKKKLTYTRIVGVQFRMVGSFRGGDGHRRWQIEDVDEILNCADMFLSDVLGYRSADTYVLFLSDSDEARERAKKYKKVKNVVVPPLTNGTFHVDLSGHDPDGTRHIETLGDAMFLSLADALVLTESSFGHVAASLGFIPHTNILYFNAQSRCSLTAQGKWGDMPTKGLVKT